MLYAGIFLFITALNLEISSLSGRSPVYRLFNQMVVSKDVTGDISNSKIYLNVSFFLSLS